MGDRKRGSDGPKRRRSPAKRTQPPSGRRRRRRGSDDVREELLRLGGRKGGHYYAQLVEAADAFADDRNRDALRILRPLRDLVPDSPSVRELLGLAQYRTGNFAAAAKELEVYVELTGAADQHPVLMDCYRAQRRWHRVEVLWLELTAQSPSPEAVTEGRIVAAGALADRGELDAAITLLGRRERDLKQPKDHHLRLWYALADLEERAGNLSRARALFQRVRKHDPTFADVAERLAALG